MKSSIPMAKVVAEAVVLGVYQGEAASDLRLILFLARSEHASWTVGGRFPSAEEGWAPRVAMPYRTFRTAIQRLTKARVVTVQRLGNSYTYALSQQFLAGCRALYEIRFDLAAIEGYHNSHDSTSSSAMMKFRQSDDEVESSLYRAQEEHVRSATADAARGLRPHEGEPMTDFPTDDGFGPTKKRGNRWGGDPAGPTLGEDLDRPMAARAVRGPDPRSKAVRDVRQAFEVKLGPISRAKKVPMFGQVGKAMGNIQYMLDQGHDLATIVGAFDYFAGQTDSLVFMGDSLWDKFFAQRDEAIRLATIAAIGAHDGPRESLDDKAKRLMTRSTLRKDA